jgi:glycosyltransferase involved in cell wall biosynthesis
MNIWVVQTGEPISFVDGGSRLFRSEMLINRLLERGHSVLRWTSTFDHSRKNFRFLCAQDVVLGSGLRYRFLHSPTAYSRSLSWRHAIHDRELADAFEKSASDEPLPDIILCAVPPLRLARRVTEYAHRHNVPLILDVRDTWPDSLLKNLKFPLRTLARWIFRHEFRRAKQVFHRADGIAAISAACLRWSLRQADRKFHRWDRIFPLAYEEPPQNVFSSDEQRSAFLKSIGAENASAVVTCLGRIGFSFDYGAVLALAQSYADAGRRDVQFVLAGEELESTCRKKISAKPVNLTITGWLDQEELHRLLAVTTVGLLPYRHIHCPAIRNKPLDFLSMGVPVVSSLRGEFSFLMAQHNFGIAFPPGDSSRLRDGVDKLLLSPKLRQTCHENGLRLFREKFLANSVYGDFASYLENFLDHWRLPERNRPPASLQ